MGLQWTSVLLVLLLVGQTLQMDLNPNDYDAEYVSFHSLETRNANGERVLQFRAFDQDYNLLLQPAEIFAPNYKYMEVEVLENGKTAILERESTILNGHSGQLYNIAETQGSVYVTDKDIVEVNGMLDDHLVVMPVPFEEFSSDGASHVIYKKRQGEVVDRTNDYIELFTVETPEVMERQSAPSEVTVKVLVVMDNLNTVALRSSQSDIESYAAVFWNSVQKRYAPASNPKVKLAIAGLVVMPSASSQPFVTKALASNDPLAADGSVLLDGFRDWLKSSQKSKTFDAAIFHTALDGFDHGSGSRSQAGLAYLATACGDSAAGYGEDKVPFFTGVTTIAHELGHILSSPHDGESTSSGCSPATNNLMAPSGGPGMPNQWTFSRCSLSAITSYLGSAKGKCTWTPPGSVGVKISEVLPGFWSKGKSLDDFCAAVHGNGWAYYAYEKKSVCDSLFCQLVGYTNLMSKGPAPEGTPCGYNKMCSNGFCEASSVPSVDQQCAAKGGSRAANVFDPSACSNLKCQGKQVGAAQEGTSCGLAGVCKNKQCVGQVTTTLDKECQKYISNPGFVAAQTDAEKGSCTFRCVQDMYDDVPMDVPDQLPCGERSVCQKKRCVPI